MPHTKMFKACSQRQPKSPLSAPYSEIPPKKSPLPHGWGLFRYNILMTSIIHRISCFVACPMKRKGKASRVRWKNRCRFPAGLICASGVKAVSANSGGRIDRTRSMSRMSLECLRCIPLAASVERMKLCMAYLPCPKARSRMMLMPSRAHGTSS